MPDIVPLISLAFISGIITSFQPCIFPLLPTYFSYMNSYKKEKVSIIEGLIVAIFLTLGILVIFMTLGLLVKLGQFGLNTFLNSHVPEFNFIMAILLIIFGTLMLLGHEMTFFYRLPGLSSIIVSQDPQNKLIASFLLGLAYTAIAAPCAAPIFLSIIGQLVFFDPMSTILVILIYSIGCGIPFLVIGLTYPNFSQEIKTDYSQIAKYIKPFSGFILLSMSFYLLNNFVISYYPITIGSFTFLGFNKEFISNIYIGGFVLLVILLIVGLIILQVKYLDKKKNESTLENSNPNSDKML